MKKSKWRIIENFVLNDGRFDSEDFEDFLNSINDKKMDNKKGDNK